MFLVCNGVLESLLLASATIGKKQSCAFKPFSNIPHSEYNSKSSLRTDYKLPEIKGGDSAEVLY